MKQFQKTFIFILTLLSLSFFLLSLKLTYQNRQLRQQISELTTQTVLIPTPTLTDLTTPNQEQEAGMADWKTYRNEKLDFELKYPTNWSFKEFVSRDEESVFEAETKEFSSPEPTSLSWLTGFKQPCDKGIEKYDPLGPNPPYILTKAICKDYLYITLNVWEDAPEKENYKNILDQILSTFRFLDN